MISIEVAPSQFAPAIEALTADDNGKVDFAENSKTSGHVHTSQIDADFAYQERSATSGTIMFTNEVKHGMYKFVSDDTIGQHLTALLSKLPPIAAPEPEPESTEPTA
jgi:hypothetical protein